MWSALTSSSNFVLESLETFVESTGIAGLLANMGWGSLVMICVAFFLLYLAIKHKFEPLLLLTIAFGMLLTNLPGANLYHTELFAGGHVHWDIFVANAGLLDQRPHTSNGAGFLDAFCPSYKGQPFFVDAPSVSDGSLITAGATGALMWTKQILERLDVFSPDTLRAWYDYFSTGEAQSFFTLMQSLPSAR